MFSLNCFDVSFVLFESILKCIYLHVLFIIYLLQFKNMYIKIDIHIRKYPNYSNYSICTKCYYCLALEKEKKENKK